MTSVDEQEHDLVYQARNGDSQAMATLLRRNYAVVFRYMVKLTLDARAAEDATQDAMERAVLKFQSFDPEKARFSTWLVTIARNRWLDEIRRRKHLVYPAQTTAAKEDNPVNDYDAVMEHDELILALKRLDSKTQTPITMYYMLGYSYQEIAEVMKIPLGTVKSRISNGIKTLRKEIKCNE